MNDLERTIHYTTRAQKICSNLIKYIPEDAQLIEPFVGDGDLLSLFPEGNWETYDIKAEQPRDTLLDPPDYQGKWVITNPPYLAKNKAKDKAIFEKYGVDDLYKAFLLSILDCAGGIVIIPTNFLTDERTGDVRKQFLDKFKIWEINIFTEPVFDTTTYSVCSFAFEAKDKPIVQIIKANIEPMGKETGITIYPEYNYRLAGEFYHSIGEVDTLFGRLVGVTSKDYITNIKLIALDTRSERIRAEFCKEHYEGKATDRVYATLTCKVALTEEQERWLVDEFNKELEAFRAKYFDLSLTNYRDYNRKRIGFTFAYQLFSKIYKGIGQRGFV